MELRHIPGALGIEGYLDFSTCAEAGAHMLAGPNGQHASHGACADRLAGLQAITEAAALVGEPVQWAQGITYHLRTCTATPLDTVDIEADFHAGKTHLPVLDRATEDVVPRCAAIRQDRGEWR